MDPARITELLAPFLEIPANDELPAANDERPTTDDRPQLYKAISIYIDILLRWNARINLTAVRDPEQIVTRHFGESLFAARHLFPLTSSVSPVSSVVRAPRVADLGSGAGFPGIPIKLWAPQISLTLIESNQKKATFLREAARALTLTDIDIFNGRAEDLIPDGGGRSGNPVASFGVVTLRAVERFERVLPVAAQLLAPNGRLALLVGSAQETLARAGLPSFSWQKPLPIPGSKSRVLLLATSST